MHVIVDELCEILEVSEVPLDRRFDELPEWDSLNALSVIAHLDARYNISLDARRLRDFESIGAFVEFVASHSGKSGA